MYIYIYIYIYVLVSKTLSRVKSRIYGVVQLWCLICLAFYVVCDPFFIYVYSRKVIKHSPILCGGEGHRVGITLAATKPECLKFVYAQVTRDPP